MAMSFAIELVQDVAAFERLREEWNGLLADMDQPEVFYGWEWNAAYRRHFRPDDALFVVLLREGTELAGLAPLCIRNERRLGVRVRAMETIVAGLSDYSNILVRQGTHRGRLLAALVDVLRQHASRWDVINLWDFCTRDASTGHLLQLASAQTDWSVRTHVTSPVVTYTLAAAEGTANERQIRQIRNRRKALEARGLRLRIGSGDLEVLWPAFCELHRKAWPAGPFHDPVKQAFYDELKSSLSARGEVEFSVAELDGRPVALHFGFVDRRKVYYYMPAFDRAFARERIGAVLLQAMVEHYAATHETFDFLRGLEPYKLWYTDRLDLNLRLVVYRSSNLRALAYNLADVTRRFGVELGLPKVAGQLVRRLLRRT